MSSLNNVLLTQKIGRCSKARGDGWGYEVNIIRFAAAISISIDRNVYNLP